MMAQLDSTSDSNYKTSVQIAFDDKNSMNVSKNQAELKNATEAKSDEFLFEKNPLAAKGRHIINNNDLFRLSTEVTPMYIKNPNTTKNRLSTAIDASSKLPTAEKDERSFQIEPSPSGVTRIKINNFDANNNNMMMMNPLVSNQNNTDFIMPAQPAYYPNYKPVTVEFKTNNSSFYPARMNHQNELLTQKPNKIDISTSPIKILNAYKNPDDYVNSSQKDASTQMEQAGNKETNKSFKDTGIVAKEMPRTEAEEAPKTGIFVKNKEVKASLEKSKLIIVNVTPKVSKKDELDELTLPNSPKTKQTFEIDMDHEVQPNEPHLNESVGELPNGNFHHHLHHQQQSNQTPILTSMLKQKHSLNENAKLMSINEEKAFRKSDSNEILNLESNCYYDNIIKLKQNGIHQNEQIFATEPENNGFDPDQNENAFNYNNNLNKLIEKLNDTKNNSINKRDQCLQFPTPSMENNEKKLPRTYYAGSNECINTESKTGFINVENNIDTEIHQANFTHVVETFYDGNKVWTAATNIVHKSNSMEQQIQDENLDDIYSSVNKKKNVQVKIKLPNETVSEIFKPEPKSKQKAQKCCLCMFIFFILLIALGIVLYFFAWDILIKRNVIF